VSIARWNLKEAAGKAWSDEQKPHEASKLDEEAHIFKVQYLYGELERICARYKREGECAIPRQICQPVRNYRHREASGRVGRSQQTA
jgi:hypothetical protein